MALDSGLRERVARALRDRWDEQPTPDWPTDRLAEKLALADADAALAALGLDDLDAAVLVMTDGFRSAVYEMYGPVPGPMVRCGMRGAIAALTATEGPHDG